MEQENHILSNPEIKEVMTEIILKLQITNVVLEQLTYGHEYDWLAVLHESLK